MAAARKLARWRANDPRVVPAASGLNGNNQMDVSVVIRTLNEARHLRALLEGVRTQAYRDGRVELVVVDSGSTDGTLEIAREFEANVVHIAKEEFSFGRSLNLGCAVAS